MTFVTVIRTGTFPDGSIEVELDGSFTGNLTGNVDSATCILFASGQGIKIGNVNTVSSDSGGISIGKGSISTMTGTIAIGENAQAVSVDSIIMGRPETTSGLSSTATAEAWGQVFQNRAWDEGNTTLALIDGTGNLIKGTGTLSGTVDWNCINMSNIEDITLDTIIPKVPSNGVTINGNVSVIGDLTVTGNLLNVALFRVAKTATQTISDNTTTKVSFDTEDSNNINVSGMGSWDDGTDTFTITGSGWYNIVAAYNFSDDISNKYLIQIFINGVSTDCFGQGQMFATGMDAHTHLTCVVYLTSGDTVDVRATHTVGSDRDIQAGYFSLHLLPGTSPSAIEQSKIWGFQTNQTTQYAGGFYDFFSGNDDFSPSIVFGTANVSKAAHLSVITGAVTVDQLTIRVTGTSITDNGVQTGSDTEDIVIPNTTAANSYYETSKKWNGQLTIEAISGTAIQCNYGWSKYHDVNNRNFTVTGIETTWESDSTDSSSNIQLIHHKSTGWTYNAGSTPTPPLLVARNTDHAGNIKHEIGSGAWKRSNLSTIVLGSASEGVLWCITSGTTGVGSLSFKQLNLELSYCIN